MGAAASSPAKPVPAHKAAPGKTVKADAAEKFTERVITDADHGGMRAATLHLPEKWHFESKIEWHYGWVEYSITFSSHSENPDNVEVYF